MDKNHQIVIVSRADSAIGQRIVRILTRHKVDLVLLYQNLEVIQHIAENIYDSGNDCIIYPQQNVRHHDFHTLLHLIKTNNLALGNTQALLYIS